MARSRVAVAVGLGAALVAGVAWFALGRDARERSPATSPPHARDAAPPLAGKAFYRIDAGAAPPCRADATCEAHLVLTALGAYHVNQEYPFKFIVDDGPAVVPLEPATFRRDDPQHGTLTIRFRPEAAGTARLAGTFKLSVCSDDTCEIEAPEIALAIPVH